MVLYSETQLFELIKTYCQDVEVSMNDIKHPTSTFTSELYNAILCELGVQRESLCQMQNTQLTIISYVDMYQNTVPSINMCKAISYFLERLGITDFGLSDIVNPSPKRTTMIVSTFMHFMSYCDKKINKLMETGEMDAVKSLVQTRRESLAEIERLRNAINVRAEEHAKQGDKIDELRMQIDKKTKKLQELKVQKESVIGESTSAKQYVENDEKQLGRLKEQKNAIMEKIEVLKQQVVASPGKIKEEFDELMKKKEEVTECNENLNNNVKERKTTNAFLQEQLTQRQCRYEKLQNIILIKGKLSEMQKYLEELRKQNDEWQRKKTDLLKTKEDEEMQLKLLAENNQRIKIESDKQKGRYEAEKQKIEKEKASMQNEIGQLEMEITEMKELLAREKKTEDMNMKCGLEMKQTYEESCAELEREFAILIEAIRILKTAFEEN